MHRTAGVGAGLGESMQGWASPCRAWGGGFGAGLGKSVQGVGVGGWYRGREGAVQTTSVQRREGPGGSVQMGSKSVNCKAGLVWRGEQGGEGKTGGH